MFKTKIHILTLISALTTVGIITAASAFAFVTYDTDNFDLNINVNGYQTLSNNCSGSFDLGTLEASNGNRYNSDKCAIDFFHNDPATKFAIYVNKTETYALSDTASIQSFADINNVGSDCVMDSAGNTDEEEFGYRIDEVVLSDAVNITVQTDPTCSVAYNAAATAPDEYFFDLADDDSTGMANNKIIQSAGTAPYPVCLSGECSFSLLMGVNVGWDTLADVTYSKFRGTSANYTVIVTSTIITP
ncbi:hypothetical protein C0416_01625 [bacterium]|nr:hypothetical protein [bacterium]